MTWALPAGCRLPQPALLRGTTTATNRRPNILLIMSDEHDPAVSGCYGDPVARTPHLDALAREGVLFDAFYTTSPLCVPARLSFLSGKYPSHMGVWNNDCWLPSDDMPTIPHLLNAAGYESYLSGKMHLDITRRYGLTELFPSDWNRWAKKGRGRRRLPDDQHVNKNNWLKRAADFKVDETSPVLEHDRQVTEACCQFLRNRRPDEAPFFLIAGYLAPHFPLTIPAAQDNYRDRLPMPTVPEGYLETLPLNYQHVRRASGVVDAEEATVKRGRELYWGLVEWVDGAIGQVLSALADSPVADNTIVIYTADHGENKGDHGMWWKNCMFDSAARIPLIVRWPERWPGGQRRSGPCSLVDLSRTILEIAGLQAPADWAGRSLLGWLDDPQLHWDGLAVSEYYGYNIASGFAMVRQGNFKYVFHARMNREYGPERELYDLEADPQELHNLASQPAQQDRLKAMHALLLRELGESPNVTEQRCRRSLAKGYKRASDRLPTPEEDDTGAPNETP
ncbi:MAG: sulfatase-like hydrolase/transferase [Chloroflexi bacterium]|nr:sulfatase-like hydrolase/transferase [Chloroflexota bacterium]